ncbi:c-type cytochrome [Achromobacter deleyi]|uniref:c-type cytochrome n=1 Tax=Achromobacter deleyi TaxID=1353891 RepID=UPI001491387E|nr:c-type cytochrome [Achromobacter deleyi]QVQ29005.1 cytochrome c5 family protein [Achromobacter deleyi]UIP19123.1 c-type cytochrome [Achromobacter deleyi]
MLNIARIAFAAALASLPVQQATADTLASVNPAGEKLYKSACVVCHASGVANAPKLGDKQAWSPFLAQGADALMVTVLKGKGAMPPRGGSAADEATLRAAVEYMMAAAR